MAMQKITMHNHEKKSIRDYVIHYPHSREQNMLEQTLGTCPWTFTCVVDGADNHVITNRQPRKY